MGEAVKLEQDGGLAVVTLDRPEAMNALNMDMTDGLLDAVVACDDDPKVRALITAGRDPRIRKTRLCRPVRRNSVSPSSVEILQ